MSQTRPDHKKVCKKAQKEFSAAAEADQHAALRSEAAIVEAARGDVSTQRPPPHGPTGCGHCGHASPDLLVCAGCHVARYCSAAHQRAAWFGCAVRVFFCDLFDS